jgi:hypothetical protein
MNRRSIILGSTVISVVSFALIPSGAVAQQRSLKEQLVGTWTFVGSDSKLADGSPQWGATPKGQMIFAPNGTYSNILMRSDIPKYASNNRLAATAEENKATVQGLIATFGTYTVNEADRSYTVRVEGSSFPNWIGTDLKRTVASVDADELRVNNPAPSTGGRPSQLVYRRTK